MDFCWSQHDVVRVQVSPMRVKCVFAAAARVLLCKCRASRGVFLAARAGFLKIESI